MTPGLHRTPARSTVLREQLRAVLASLRIPILVFAGIVGIATLFGLVGFLGDGRPLDFTPELTALPALLGALLPVGVWMGEERFGTGFRWSMPVERRWHALARVGAGWCVLMAVVAAFVLWQAGATLVTGGSFLAERVLQLLPDPALPDPVDPAALRSVRWTPQPLFWLASFTGATGTYLLASAVALGLRRPARWFAAMAALLFVAGTLADLVGRATGARWLVLAPSRVLRAVLYGPFGFDTLVTARNESLHTGVLLTTGERAAVWTALPDVGDWAVATAAWLVAGAVALWAAAARHRERRAA